MFVLDLDTLELMNKVLCFIVLFNLFLSVNLLAQTNQTVSNGALTNAVNFPGGCSYTWTNDNPAIGLPASGAGNIAAFTADNTGLTAITATIKGTPLPGVCSPVAFTITVNPEPTLTVGPYTVNTIICEGSAALVTQFEISGSFLTGNVDISKSGDFAFSTSEGSNSFLQPVNGTLAPNIIYVNTGGNRGGNKTGTIGFSSPGMATKNVTISALIDKLPTADALPNLKFKSGDRWPT